MIKRKKVHATIRELRKKLKKLILCANRGRIIALSIPTECAYRDELLDEIACLKTVLVKVATGLESKDKAVQMNVMTLYRGQDTPHARQQRRLFRENVDFNTHPGYDYFAEAEGENDERVKTLFHELTHTYGANHKSGHLCENARTMESLVWHAYALAMLGQAMQDGGKDCCPEKEDFGTFRRKLSNCR